MSYDRGTPVADPTSVNVPSPVPGFLLTDVGRTWQIQDSQGHNLALVFRYKSLTFLRCSLFARQRPGVEPREGY